MFQIHVCISLNSTNISCSILCKILNNLFRIKGFILNTPWNKLFVIFNGNKRFTNMQYEMLFANTITQLLGLLLLLFRIMFNNSANKTKCK